LYKPEIAAVFDAEAAAVLKGMSPPCDVLSGMEGLIAAASVGADMVINALVGGIGLRPTLAAIEAGADIGLANKEALVVGGEIVTKLAKEKNVRIIPIDSEHSAVFQCVSGRTADDINKIYLTASGGPFRGFNRGALEHVTAKDALKHPNWVMGDKITIDSATMMNKGFEVIEAKWLFGIGADRIEVLIHPQSVIHSMVEFTDGSVLAQLGLPDMRLPIFYALTYPKRKANSFPKIDFLINHTLTFEAPDFEAFPCLALAYGSINFGGTMPAVMNFANEYAVAEFLAGKIKFTDIPRLIKGAMDRHNVKYDFDLEDVEAAEVFAAERCRGMLGGDGGVNIAAHLL
jgi:1-deoxy-D-xylulose-5-phosphate reductoisomerase